MRSPLKYWDKHKRHPTMEKGITEILSWSYDAISQKIVPHSNIFSSTWAASIFHLKWVLPFPVKIYPFEIFTRATPVGSLVQKHLYLSLSRTLQQITDVSWLFWSKLDIATSRIPVQNLSFAWKWNSCSFVVPVLVRYSWVLHVEDQWNRNNHESRDRDRREVQCVSV